MIDTRFEGFHIKFQISSILIIVGGSQTLAGKQLVMVLPVDILVTSTHRGFCGRHGMRVNCSKRKVAINKPDLIWILRKELLVYLRMPLAAKRALIITEFHNGNGSVCRTGGISASCGDFVADGCLYNQT